VYESGDVVVIDTASNTVIGDPIELNQYPGYVSSNGKRLYLTSLNPDDISNLIVNQNAPPPPGYVTVVDIDPNSPTYNTEIDRIEVGKYAVNVAMSPDGSLAYVVNAGDGTVSVIDTATDEVLTTFTYDPDPSGQFGDASFIAMSPDGNRLYASRFLDGEAVAISIVPGSEVV
jgi:YVTN family beta-propeller protein